MKTRTCAVCGKTKTINQFGNGIKSSKNTCLDCVKKARNRDKPKPIKKPEKPDPIKEYLNTVEASEK